ncbi:1-acyl-sn-glycerol-3-phosphate acyltransferase, partial [Streptomyces sp. NPDC029004]
MKIDTQGSENIPRSGGAVLVSNHISYLDFVFT